MEFSRLFAGLAMATGALVAFAVARPLLGAAPPELRVTPEPTLIRSALEPHVQLLREDVRADPAPPRFIPVSGDVPAWVAPAYVDTPRVVVYLHGMCGDPTHARDWALVVAKSATLIALRGDSECHGGGQYWRPDPTFLDYRISKAVRSVGAALGRPLDDSSLILFGYSQGAERAEDLASVFPRRYRRVALMSGPRAPRYEHVRRIERLAVVRGELEYSKTYRESAAYIAQAGLSAEFFELPGARHGEFGPDAPDAIGRVLDFLLADD